MSKKFGFLQIQILVLIVIAIIVLILIGVSGIVYCQPFAEPDMPFQQPQEDSLLPWNFSGLAIPGRYADAEVIYIGSDTYRMYFSAEPEVSGNRLELYSATSNDGITWQKEAGIRKEFATFADIVALANGRYRMYFQNQGVIKSAISKDGLSWTDEAGVRIDTLNTAGLALTMVAAPTAMKVGDEYVMVYSGTIDQKYPAQVPNQDTHLFLWAVSKDGLNFEKKGIALESRNSIFQGWVDGPEFVKWDDGSVRLYFWSYRGIYHVDLENDAFSQDAQFDYTTSFDPRIQFPMSPPCDPTLAKINGKWFMYYGQHEKGIYYATH